MIYHSVSGENPPIGQVGVYGCRIDDPHMPGLHEDRFMLWHDGQWCYLRSDQTYRGPVYQWVGPIPRTRA